MAPPKNETQVISFHGLASLYRRFVKDFSTIVTPLDEIVKKMLFLNGAPPNLALPKFSKSFEIQCDASNIKIGVILMQEGYPISYFSEKLKGFILNYST